MWRLPRYLNLCIGFMQMQNVLTSSSIRVVYYVPAMALQFTSAFISLPLSVERTMGRVGKKENNVLWEKIISGDGARARQATARRGGGGAGTLPPRHGLSSLRCHWSTRTPASSRTPHAQRLDFQILNLDRLFRCERSRRAYVSPARCRAAICLFKKHGNVLVNIRFGEQRDIANDKCVQCYGDSAKRRGGRRKGQFLSMSGGLVHVFAHHD